MRIWHPFSSIIAHDDTIYGILLLTYNVGNCKEATMKMLQAVPLCYGWRQAARRGFSLGL